MQSKLTKRKTAGKPSIKTHQPSTTKQTSLKIHQTLIRQSGIYKITKYCPCVTLTLVFRRINDIHEEYLSSNVHLSFKALLTEGLLLLKNPNVIEVVCFGLGRLSDCVISKYQLAFLLYLKERFEVAVHVYDPAFTQFDKRILEHYKCKVIETNCEGKYSLKSKGTSIVYLPHCPKQLSNNLLWKNWGLQLSNCILIANSFNKIVEGNTSKSLLVSANFITTICPHAVELSVINEFRFFEVFNDTSIHVFPETKLNLLPKDFWENIGEPVYPAEDLEFVENTEKAVLR